MESKLSAKFSSLKTGGFSNQGGFSSYWFLTPVWNGLCSILKDTLQISKEEASQILLGEITVLHFLPQGSPVRIQTPQQFEKSSSPTVLRLLQWYLL